MFRIAKQEEPLIRLKRIYDHPSKEDGFRILVDRLWPRGIAKEGAAIDLWLKEVAPSPELRQWFNHEVPKWEEFKKRYGSELLQSQRAFYQIKEYLKKGPVTLVYAASDKEHNQAVVLKEFLEKHKGSPAADK
jgi:uncharacterized protein YeaO (DUF488 family)